MNFIKQLQHDNKALNAQLAASHDAIRDLRRYVSSPKFYNDTTVQVQDVLNYLNNVDLAISQAETETVSS